MKSNGSSCSLPPGYDERSSAECMCDCNRKSCGVSVDIDNVGHVPSNAWAMQQEELETRAQHVKTSGGVPHVTCLRVGSCGRSQGPAKSATRRVAQVANAIQRSARRGTRKVGGPKKLEAQTC